jgi:hypothetical protein
MFQTGFGTMTAFWQDHLFHPQIMSELFIGFREETAITTGLAGRLVEGCEVSLQTGFPLLLIARVASKRW